MQATFPELHSNEVIPVGKTPPKTWVTELNRWLQALVVLAGVLTVGMTVEHRLTSIENKYDAANSTLNKTLDAQKETNSVLMLLLQSEQTSFEIILKMKLPRDDRQKANEILTQIKAKKIGQATFTDAKARAAADGND